MYVSVIDLDLGKTWLLPYRKPTRPDGPIAERLRSGHSQQVNSALFCRSGRDTPPVSGGDLARPQQDHNSLLVLP